MLLFHRTFVLCLSLLIAACGSNDAKDYIAGNDCQFEHVKFDANFQTGRLSGCRQISRDEYELTIDPESVPAHHSPWYAFRVVSSKENRIVVKLRYTEKSHRYPPKTSTDKLSWSALPASRVKEFHDGEMVRLLLDVGPKPLYVAGQEIIDNNTYDQLESVLAKKPFVSRSVLGKSELGRPIHKLETSTSESGSYLVLTGRQHPPEVTGALAMIYFVNTLMADTPLAKQFRDRVNMLIVFNMNPDGVALGHWRKNTNGVDLNRDWGPFAQAETRVVRNELARFLNTGKERIQFFLDFHSTQKDIFYTMSDSLPNNPSAKINSWLDNIQRRMPDYELRRRASFKPESYISKNYVYKTFLAPAVTYELGDNTSRSLIRKQATIAAEEMMKLLITQ